MRLIRNVSMFLSTFLMTGALAMWQSGMPALRWACLSMIAFWVYLKAR